VHFDKPQVMTVDVGLLTLNVPLPRSSVAAIVLVHSLPSETVQAVANGSSSHLLIFSASILASAATPAIPAVTFRT
jgi:hypothetical protein